MKVRNNFVFIVHRSAFILSLDSVHRVEEVFALRVDADAEAFALAAKTFFQLGGGEARA
jgi:hypothetical protein